MLDWGGLRTNALIVTRKKGRYVYGLKVYLQPPLQADFCSLVVAVHAGGKFWEIYTQIFHVHIKEHLISNQSTNIRRLFVSWSSSVIILLNIWTPWLV